MKNHFLDVLVYFDAPLFLFSNQTRDYYLKKKDKSYLRKITLVPLNLVH